MLTANIQAGCPAGRKRVCVVNCHFDEARRFTPRTTKLSKDKGPAYLAGAFSLHRYDIRHYNEATILTDKNGWLVEDLSETLGDSQKARRRLHG